MAVFPSDHFIVEEAAFMAHVMRVAAFVRRYPEWLVLLGAQPSAPEMEYGWIAKVRTLLEAGRRFLRELSDRLARIARFRDTEDEPWAVQQAYALAPKANFSLEVESGAVSRCWPPDPGLPARSSAPPVEGRGSSRQTP